MIIDRDGALLGRAPGLPDEAYLSDGLLTKRVVRASALAHLRPLPGQLLWDVGTGAGAIARAGAGVDTRVPLPGAVGLLGVLSAWALVALALASAATATSR